MPRTLSFLLMSVLVVALAAPAFADDTAPNLGKLKYSGVEDVKTSVPTDTWAWPDPVLEGSVSADYKWEGLKLVAGGSFRGGEGRQGEFFPGETVAFVTLGPVKVGAGWQEFSWGVADKLNPTDTLNARDYSAGPDGKRLVNPAVSLVVYPADWVSLEAVYEPWKEATRLPVDFRAETQAGLSAQAALLAASGIASSPVATETASARDFSAPVYGGRVNLFLPVGDFSVSYLQDRDAYSTPVVTLASVGPFWVPGTVELTHAPVQRFGLNAKTTVDRYGLWLESAYNLNEGNDTVDWTAGLDFSFGEDSAFYANLQYAGQWVFGYDDSVASDYAASPTSTQLQDKASMLRRTTRLLTQTLAGQTQQWTNSVAVNVKLPLADGALTPTLSGAVLLPSTWDSGLSALLQPSLDLMPVDGLHTILAAQVVLAKSGATDKLALFEAQNNVSLTLHYLWNGSLGN
jgi:hypothetical protein